MSSIIGIDFGNENCIVAVANRDGVETLDNDYSLRATPSYVAFGERGRILGVAAKNRQVTNVANTISGFKRMLGWDVGNKYVQQLNTLSQMTLVPVDNGRDSQAVGYPVQYRGEKHKFTAEQVTGMLFTKLKQTTEQALQTKIKDCVVSVPSFFSDGERRSLLKACQLSGLNVLHLLNDSTSVALQYGYFRTDLPSAYERPRNVFFVDCGHSALQISACAFRAGRFKMLASLNHPHLGGQDFDNCIVKYFCEDFKQRYGLDVSTNRKAFVRLLNEVEKLKKQMSANKTKLKLIIESFMDDVDVEGTICREEFEEMASDLFKSFEYVLKQCLFESGLQLEQIHSIEIVGGSTRIPALKDLVTKVFKQPPSTTLNADEAVARGCALKGAILTKMFREYSTTSLQHCPINVSWEMENKQTKGAGLFSIHHFVPFTRAITINRRLPVKISALYPPCAPVPSRPIGIYKIGDFSDTRLGNGRIKIKFRLDQNGLFSVVSADFYRRQVLEKDTTVDPANPASTPSMGMDPVQSNEEDESEYIYDEESGLSLEHFILNINKSDLNIPEDYFHRMLEQENRMISVDQEEEDRSNARNELEEFIYKLKEQLETDLQIYTTEEERAKIMSVVNDIEAWVYENEEETKESFIRRLNEIKEQLEPIHRKQNETQRGSVVFDQLCNYLNSVQRFIAGAGATHRNNLTTEELETVNQEYWKVTSWKNQACGEDGKLLPSITASEVSHVHDELTQTLNPIIFKTR